jgi:outer membrane protein
MLKKISIAIFMLASASAFAQQGITLQQAIEAGLKNSFDIQLARNNEEIAKNNASYGNAGFLPGVSINAAQSNSINNTHQEYSSGQVIDRSGANSSNLNAGVALNWTLFDGFRMFTTYNKLQEYENRGELVTKLQMQQVVADITQQYYEVVRLQEQVKVLEEAVKLSDERINLAKERKEIGAGSNFDLLQSQLDQNRDRALLLQLQSQLTTARVQLNQVVGQDPASKVTVADTVIPVRTLNYDELKKAFAEKNQQLQLAQIDMRIAMLEVKETKSQQLPRISFNTGYNFTNASTEAGLVTLNQNQGLNYGLSLTYPIFNGFNVRRQIRNANLELENSKLESGRLTLELNSAFEIIYRNYEAAQQLTALEQTNLDIARQNLDIANEKFRLGSISALELRDLQIKYIDAHSNLLDANSRVKSSEIQLMQLSDMLPAQ